jgi:hypothetical protein
MWRSGPNGRIYRPVVGSDSGDPSGGARAIG